MIPYRLLLASVVFMCLGSACCAGQQNIGTVTYLEGKADILRGSEIVDAGEGAKVFVQDRIRTKKYSKLELIFSDKSIVRLAPSSCIAVEEFTMGEKNKRQRARITLSRGKSEMLVWKSGASDTFIVDTPNASSKVKGSDIFFSYLTGQTGVLVKSGHLSVSNLSAPANQVRMTAGDVAFIPFTEPPTPPRPYLDAELMRYEKEVAPPPLKEAIPLKKAKAMNGVIISMSNGVRIYKKGTAEPHTAAIDEILSEGDKIQTAQDGLVEIRIDNGNIISLQPNSEITLTTMLLDPESGEYNNTFESTYGRIKAIVEKLGNKSTFQIKTPVAVCGVRGTVMYVDIQPSGITAFYEGGYGLITSLVTGESQIVESGQNSMVNDQGAVSTPAATSNEQKLELNKTWESGKLMGEHSKPDKPIYSGGGALFSAFFVIPLGEWAARMGGYDIKGDFIPEVFDKLKFEEMMKQESQNVVTDFSFTGNFGYIDVVSGEAAFADPQGTLSGDFSFPRSGYAPWGGNEDGTLSGTYSNLNPTTHFLLDGSYECTAADGGRYKGWMEGCMIGGKLFVTAAAIDIDPTGHAGALTAFFDNGTYDPGASTFIATGEDKIIFTTRDYLGILPQDLFTLSMPSTPFSGRGAGIMGSETITCDDTQVQQAIDGTFRNIAGLNWGVWSMDLKGVWSAPTDDEWKLFIGGESNLVNPDDGVWLGTVKGKAWNSLQLSGGFMGIWLSKTNDTPGDEGVSAGIILNGHIVGGYTASPQTWQAAGSGEWVQRTTELNESALGFTIADLKTFVSIPISEYTSLWRDNGKALVGPQGGSTANFVADSCFMDTWFYTSGPDKIWTGVVDGWHSGTMPDSWNLMLSFSSECDITFNGDEWNDGKWHASVNNGANTPTGVEGFSGDAAGTYEPDGSFQGVAAGRWTATP